MRIATDDADVQRMLAQLDVKNLRRTTKAAFRAAGNVIKAQAVKNYKNMFPGSSRWRALAVMPFRQGNGAYVKGQTFQKMSLRKVLSTVKAVEKAGGSLQDAKNATSGSYVLQILEGGSGPRQSAGRSKKGKYNRGKVSAYRFFESAVKNSADAAEKKFISIVEKKIQKLNK